VADLQIGFCNHGNRKQQSYKEETWQ
jgi:hypothetical protein